MSAFLPTVQDDAQSLANQEELLEIAAKEPSDPGGRRSSGSSEDGETPLLHTTSTLEYSGGNQHSVAGESDIEMATFAASRPEVEASEADARRADNPEAGSLDWAAGAATPEKEGEPVGAVPIVFDPSVRVLVPHPAALTAERSSLRGSRDEQPVWADGGKPLGNGASLERQPFLVGPGSHGQRPPARNYAPPDAEWPDSDSEARGEKRPQCPRCTRTNLKATAALAGSLIIYPCFLYGAYVFLPFDVPLMPNVNAQMVYTLRCSIFATVPILMGIIVYGLARLCSSSVDPFGERKEEVEIHQRFVTDSIHLFVLFFVNLIVLSTYIPHEALKLLPLLTAFFALARLIYWLTFAISSTFRGFGYGLTFFPILGLLVCNLCYMFLLAPDKMFATSASEAQEEEKSASPRQRFWG